ncbi:MAG TPA: hypothetical protein VFQ53_37355 [Kofleriaceae bacterium]|nr:hypothetical protein [Kofleriaceae bacterium]
MAARSKATAKPKPKAKPEAKPARTAAQSLAHAKKLADPGKRADYLERELARVDRPAKLVEPLFDALADCPISADEMAARGVAIAKRHGNHAPLLAAIGCELDDRYREDEALEVLRLAVTAKTTSKDALETLGRLLVLRGDEAGVPLLERAIAKAPSFRKARVALAAWFVDRDPERALAVLGDVQTGRAWDLRAMIHARAGRSVQARRALGEALELFDSAAEAHKELSEWHFLENRYDRAFFHAKALFERRAELTADEVDLDEVDEAIAQGYRVAGAFAELLPWLRERCQSEIPGALGWQLFFGLTASHPVLDFDLALAGAEAAMRRDAEQDDPSEVRRWRVRIAGLRAEERGDLAALEALAADGLDDDPGAWLELANAYDSVELRDAAHAALDRALLLDPESAEALSVMFDLALAAGDAETLHKASEALAARKPDWHQGHEHLGRSFARRLDATAAVHHARKAVELAPYCHNAWLGLAEAQLAAGALDPARDALARSLQIDAAQPGDDVSIVRAALDRDTDALEAALAARYRQLPALPFPEFIARLRAAARA